MNVPVHHHHTEIAADQRAASAQPDLRDDQALARSLRRIGSARQGRTTTITTFNSAI